MGTSPASGPDHPARDPAPARRPVVAVFAPSPLLTVTIEHDAHQADEVHLHAGGQGFWIARMLVALGVQARLCAPFGGEVGHVLQALISAEAIHVSAGAASRGNGAYVHDRRHGDRTAVADMAPIVLSRHEVDDLYGTTLAEGMAADVTVLGGPATSQVVPADIYRRLAADLRAVGKTVVADLSGAALTAALQGGITVLKVSHEDLIADQLAADADQDTLTATMLELARAGADHVVLSRGGQEPTLALVDGDIVEVLAPQMQSVDERGAGDSMTAGLAAALAGGSSIERALRLAAAAGASNVTRKGLGTGKIDLIEQLSQHITIRPVSSE
jgi:1-phosphofructokinase